MNRINNNSPLILGIETSCDETAAAVYAGDKGVIASRLFSQVALHRKYGGVVPEMASRSQIEKINGIVDWVLHEAQITLSDIEVIGVTTNPGLVGSLLVGLCFAKGLAYGSQKKIIGVNHLEGHIYSACIENNIPFPFICLTASGGHTSMYLVHDYRNYQLLGTTADDAAGEAFDKVAKMLNLGYPGGPIIEKLAHEANFEDFYHYPRLKKKSLDFSFSGLKTAVLYNLVNQGAYDLKNKVFLAADNHELHKRVSSSFLVCVKDIFIDRLKLALEAYPQVKAVAFVGGVACNAYLRDQIQQTISKRNIQFFTPSSHYCTDNAAMIAFVAYHKMLNGQFSDLSLDVFN